MTIEAQIIERHAAGVRHRARIEMRLVKKLTAQAKKYGYKLIESENDVEATLGILFNLDDAFVLVEKNGERIGWVRLVFGNDGYDLVSDYTMNLESFLEPVNALADKIEREGR